MLDVAVVRDLIGEDGNELAEQMTWAGSDRTGLLWPAHQREIASLQADNENPAHSAVSVLRGSPLTGTALP